MAREFELGVMTFGELAADPVSNAVPGAAQRMRDLLEQAAVADQVGLDVFGAGEHHRSDFVVAAPPVVLAAAAERTTDIRLTSAVTVLGSEDPVRVYQNFATVDLISGGRAEIIAGRGSFAESFPLFGYERDDYADLFREKLAQLLAIRAANPAVWTGTAHTRDLTDLDIAPRPVGDLPIWVGVGGTIASAVRTGTLGLPMALALLLGPVTQFRDAVVAYRQAGAAAGHDPAALRTSINLHGHVASTSQQARDLMYPAFAQGMWENNHQRGEGFRLPRPAFDAQVGPSGGLVVGSPQEVIDKLMTYRELYGVDRALVQIGYGGMSQRDQLAAIELLGTAVAPVLRRETAVAPTRTSA